MCNIGCFSWNFVSFLAGCENGHGSGGLDVIITVPICVFICGIAGLYGDYEITMFECNKINTFCRILTRFSDVLLKK